MGISIHYRGRIADLDCVEDFEDRVIDLVLALGGNLRLWRSADEVDRTRMVRGLFVDLAPGQETTSLLLSPEGWLIHLMQIEDAEKGRLPEPPWCWVKTQFGSVEGHIALVELLTALKREFFPDLEVSDEGSYWEKRDIDELRRKMTFLQHAIDSLADAMDRDRLSPEAAEDPQILATRIERLARQVHATISRPAEHAPVHFPDDAETAPDPQENEARWDELFRDNRRKQERMTRALEEQEAKGADAEQAFEAAIEEVIAPLDWLGEDEPEVADVETNVFAQLDEDGADDSDEPWLASLPAEACSNSASDADSFERMERHPLRRQANDLLMRFHELAKQHEDRTPNYDLLLRSAGEITGGLAQALPLPPAYEIDDGKIGLALVQLKRALRGAAFARGALFLLRADELVVGDDFRASMDECDSISEQIVELLRTLRELRD